MYPSIYPTNSSDTLSHSSSALEEDSILLGTLIGQLNRTDEEGVYQFVHRRVAAASNLQVYQNYFKRCSETPWTSSVGCGFEPVSEIKLLSEGNGFEVLIRPTEKPVAL